MAWFESHPYRKSITIQYNMVSGTQTNFPILWSKSPGSPDSDLASHALTNGTDIIFATSGASPVRIHHEIEDYGNGSGSIWVRIPSLSGRHTEIYTDIFIYYGDGTDHTDDAGYLASGVWDTNYVAVWHLNETSDSYTDSTTNSNNGTWNGGGSGFRTSIAKIGNNCPEFDGSGDNDYIEVTSDNSLDFTTFTVEGWAYTDDNTHEGGVISRNMFSPTKTGWNIEQWHSTVCQMMVQPGEGHATVIYDGVNLPQDTWYYFTMAYDDSNVYWYRNGDDTGQGAQALTIDNIDENLYMGCANPGGAGGGLRYEMNGRLDEIRLSNIQRTSGWIKTTYSSQNSPADFFSIGSEESKPVTPVSQEIELYNNPPSYNSELHSDTSSYDVEMYNSPSGYE